MEESRLDLDFGPILAAVLGVGIFQIPAGNPKFFIAFPVSWEARGSHTTTVLSWATWLGCAAQNEVPAHLAKN